MELNRGSSAGFLAVAIVSALLLAANVSPASRAAEATVDVLIDFGDGTYGWARVPVDPANATGMKATEAANGALGLPPVEVTWFDDSFCVRRPCALVTDIGDRNPSYPVWWHFLVWDDAVGAWTASTLGPSDLNVTKGAIAWYLAVDDAESYAPPSPVPSPTFRDVWTSFRGSLRNDGSAHGTIPATNAVLWDHDVGVLEIDTTPVVAYGKVFIATRNALVALDAETGREVWRNAQVRSLLSTPSIYNGTLVLGGTDGRLRAVDAETGTERWSVLLQGGNHSTGIASSPALHEGRAFVGTFNEDAGGPGAVVAVNLNNGTLAWRYETGSVHMSAPAIADGALYVGIMGVYDGVVGYAPPHGLLSLHLNGTLRWFHETDGEVASSPSVAGGLAIVTSKDGYVHAFDDAGEAWRQPVGSSTSGVAFVDDVLYVGGGAFDGTGTVSAFTVGGERIWQALVNGAVQASLTADGVRVCAATNVAAGRIVCLQAEDGSAAWSHTPVPNQYILGSPVVVGRTMYAVSDNGHVYAFRDPVPTADLTIPLAVALGALFFTFLVGVPMLAFRIRRRRKGGKGDA